MLQQRCSPDRNEWMEAAAAQRKDRCMVQSMRPWNRSVSLRSADEQSNGKRRPEHIYVSLCDMRLATCDARHGPNKFTEKSNEQYLNPLRLSSSNLHFALVSFMFMCTTFNWEHSTGSHAHEQKGQNNLQSKLLVIKLAEMIIVMVILWHTNCSISLLHNNNDLRSIIIM